MAIEFHCTFCDKLLKTTDDKAGRQAKCPGCGQLIEVPSVGGPFAGEGNVAAEATSLADQVVPPPIPLAPGESLAGDTKPCPACGHPVPAAAIRCHECGDVFRIDRSGSGRLNGRREIRPFPPGEVIADAWRIYTERMGLLIGAFLATWVLSVLTALIGWAPVVLAQLMFDRDEWVGAAIAGTIGAACLVCATAFAFYVQSGYLLLQLRVAREQPVDLSELFSGGRFAVRMALNSIVFSLMVTGGAIMCLIPGFLMALIFWPFAHNLVDEDSPGLNSLSRAKKMADGNWGSLLIVFLVAGASILAGYCACGIGLLFAMPFVNLLYAVAYDRMSCQTELDR